MHVDIALMSNVCCIVTVSTLHGALCLVRALIFPLFLWFFFILVSVCHVFRQSQL